MFKKAQLRLFSIIVSILLSVFIAMLCSINIITKAFMQRQSKVVLMKIAAGIEYDDKTSTFTFTRPEGMDVPRHDDDPPPKPNNEEPQPDGTDYTEAESTAGTEAVSEEDEQTEPETSPTDEPETHEPFTEKESQPDTEPDTPAHTEEETQEKTAPTAPPPTEETPPDMPPEFPTAPDGRPHDGREEPWGHDNGNQWPFYPDFDRWDNRREGSNEGINNTAFSEQGSIVPLAAVTTVPEEHPIENKKFDEQLNNKVPKSIGSIDFFVLMADKDGNYLSILNNDELESDDAQQYITSILNQHEETGMMDSYQFYQMKKSNGTLMVLTDKSAEFDMLEQLKRTTFIIGAISVIVLSAAAFFLSRKSIQPIKTAFDKQKQFISDASHELKTPLTVISANADVLSEEIGDNKWLNYIKTQTDRMNLLVNDLLNLTRLENKTADFIRTDFDLSKAVVNTALPFECQAFETNKKFEVDVDEDIFVNGSERHIKQMAAIFIDNALKYSGDGGTVRVILKKQGDKKIFSVFNTGQGVKDEEKDKIFERFYRSDESRNRATGGYGLGLAIAKSIIDRHKFKVSVENQEGKSICFSVTMN